MNATIHKKTLYDYDGWKIETFWLKGSKAEHYLSGALKTYEYQQTVSTKKLEYNIFKKSKIVEGLWSTVFSFRGDLPKIYHRSENHLQLCCDLGGGYCGQKAFSQNSNPTIKDIHKKLDDEVLNKIEKCCKKNKHTFPDFLKNKKEASFEDYMNYMNQELNKHSLLLVH